MKKKTHKESVGVKHGLSHLSPMGDQESSMDSMPKSQKPKPNPSRKVSRGHTIK